jgi:hypothetical protein
MWSIVADSNESASRPVEMERLARHRLGVSHRPSPPSSCLTSLVAFPTLVALSVLLSGCAIDHRIGRALVEAPRALRLRWSPPHVAH